jgi:hypothetical protein
MPGHHAARQKIGHRRVGVPLRGFIGDAALVLGRAGRPRRHVFEARLEVAPELGRALRALRGALGEHPQDQLGDALRNTLELAGRWRIVKLLAHHARQRAGEGRLAGEHVPQRRPERIDVRADIDLLHRELLRAGVMRRADKGAGRQLAARLAGTGIHREPEVDQLEAELPVLADQQQV